MRIRVAGADDADDLAALAAATFPLACPPTSDPADVAAFVAAHLDAARFAEHLADPRRTVWRADVDDEPVGYAMSVDGEPGDADVAAALTAYPTTELSKFYVAPRHHGRGVADALMARVLARATDAGAAGVWLGVNQDNGRAQRFYARQGFVVVGTKTFRLGGAVEHDFVMERRRDAAAPAAVRPAARW